MMAKASQEARFNKLSHGMNIVLNLVVFIFVALCVVPLLLMIMVSFTDEMTILQNGYSFTPVKMSLESYRYVLAGNLIYRSYGITMLVTLLGTIASLTVITFFAYPISRRDFKHRNLVSFLLFFTMIFNGGLVPWYMVYTQLIPLKDTIWAYIVPSLINAWYVLIMRTFFRATVPDELLEAAKLDGAGEFRTFFSIVLPISKPGLATIALFCMLQYWNDWFLPLMFITKTKLMNVQYILYQILGTLTWLTQNSSSISGTIRFDTIPSEGARMAIAVLSIGPIILAYPFFQRYFIKGLTIGALKG
jgi:putative aldouronate transport system permease protein